MKFPLAHRSYYLNPESKLAHDQVFTELPQSPHFSPLESFRSENIKEGIKLGCDLAFLFLVQKLRNLNDSSHFPSEVASLTAEFEWFEELGYDLTKIKQRFNLLKRRAEEEKGWKNEVVKLEQEKQEKKESVEEKEFLLVELANESVKIAKEVKMERSEIERIENKKRKVMADLNVNEFEKLSNKPW
ncbi:DUF724 domain-containing protein 10-like [Papaver somniferum]|uniref:DUF724 domain-containing protein 10-like n=1 Tax=Papaver somniferum TaxID=3469 RepID=UPI000E6F6220|nr:DUF724 domain-containing protein 10-like [Papaver somniferum]